MAPGALPAATSRCPLPPGSPRAPPGPAAAAEGRAERLWAYTAARDLLTRPFSSFSIRSPWAGIGWVSPAVLSGRRARGVPWCHLGTHGDARLQPPHPRLAFPRLFASAHPSRNFLSPLIWGSHLSQTFPVVQQAITRMHTAVCTYLKGNNFNSNLYI